MITLDYYYLSTFTSFCRTIFQRIYAELYEKTNHAFSNISVFIPYAEMHFRSGIHEAECRAGASNGATFLLLTCR